GGAAVWTCGSEGCGRTCCVLADGVNRSPLGVDDFYPELQVHPRRGIPSHGRPDKKPDGDGEFFNCRGIGLDTTPGCFVCAGDEELRHNIAAFVQCRKAGERVVAMFPYGARLDCRDSAPDRVQVKIGACDAHLPNLQKLHELTREGVITTTHICEARA
ncbi:MAG: hypothetical protein WDZ79_02890, partial [Candidatus Paceibacterota bacterium]